MYDKKQRFLVAYRMNKVLSPVAQVEKDVPPRRLQSIRHSLEAVERYGWCTNAPQVIAAVILEHVNAPSCKALRIFDLVIKRPLYRALVFRSYFRSQSRRRTEPRAGHLSSAAVHAELEVLAM
jgi:hypothetical protein